MRDIKQLALRFRDAINIAYEKGEMNKHQPFSRFPVSCCDLTCDLLGQYLLENGIKTYQINGKCNFDNQRRHVWLLAENKIIIDITGDQFANKRGFPNIVEEVHVGVEGKIHELFTMDRIEEANTIFTDPDKFTGFGRCPNFRQKTLIEVNDIIRKYL